MTEITITPRTKVAELLDTYPQLEEALIGYVPAFERLRNPVLRKTVARITSLQQAALIGGVKIDDLINHLRKEVGQDTLLSLAEVSDRGRTGDLAPAYTTEQPAWFSESRVVAELDAGAMLDAGEQPVNQAMADLSALGQGDIYRVVAPFLPAPLLDKASSLGLAHWVTPQDDGRYIIYFCRE